MADDSAKTEDVTAPAPPPVATETTEAKAAPPDKGNGKDAKPVEPDWRAGIEDQKLRDFAGRFTSPVAAVKSAMELRDLNAQSIRLITKDSTPEDVAAFYQKLGRPETKDGYKFTVPEGRPATDQRNHCQAAGGRPLFGANGEPGRPQPTL